MFDYERYGSAFVDMRLHRLRVLITEQCDDLFHAQGITTPSASVSVLLFLQQKGHASISQIAEALGYSQQLISHRVAQLEKTRFARRYTDVRDKRKRLIKLTPKGRGQAQKIERTLPQIALAFDALFKSAGVDLTEVLKTLHRSLSVESLSERTDPEKRRRLA